MQLRRCPIYLRFMCETNKFIHTCSIWPTIEGKCETNEKYTSMIESKLENVKYAYYFNSDTGYINSDIKLKYNTNNNMVKEGGKCKLN